jgi:tRNA G18 (ribose-2'-O)-methylase SpoU
MSDSLSSFELFKKINPGKIYENVSRPIIIADDIRTPANMGSIIRLGANIGAEKVIFISEKASEFKNFKINKTASGATEKIDWEIVENFELAKVMLPNGYSLIAIETSEKSENIYKTLFPEKTVFVVGNEVKGIRPEIMQHMNQSLYIPIPGPISSLNVTHALSVALFEWYRQQILLTNS